MATARGGLRVRPLGKNLNWDSRPPRQPIFALEGSNFAENCMLECPKAALFGAGTQNAFIWHPLQQPLGALRARAQLQSLRRSLPVAQCKDVVV